MHLFSGSVTNLMADELKDWLRDCLNDILSELKTWEDIVQAAAIVNSVFDAHRKRITGNGATEDEHIQ